VVLDAVELHKYCIVDVRTERAVDCFRIGAIAVAGPLHAIGEPRGKVIDEGDGRVAIAASNEPSGNQLSLGIRRSRWMTPRAFRCIMGRVAYFGREIMD
jgi:hypothetical protein